MIRMPRSLERRKKSISRVVIIYIRNLKTWTCGFLSDCFLCTSVSVCLCRVGREVKSRTRTVEMTLKSTFKHT